MKFALARNVPEYWTGKNWTPNIENAKEFDSTEEVVAVMEEKQLEGLFVARKLRQRGPGDPIYKDEVQAFADRVNAEIKADPHFQSQFYLEHPEHLPRIREVRVGQKYAKLIGDGGVWGFVDMRNGDLLKAESWSKPAKHARGNIHAGGDAKYQVNYRWTGPVYLR